MLALSAAVAAHSYTLTNETLHYDIVYHWGLIWKHAGSATLSIKKSGHNYDASLSARSEERRVGKECRSRWSPYH